MIKLNSLPPLLSRDERKQIYENWTEESTKILAERNVRWAIKIANSFQNTGIEDEELDCIAMLGLVKAAQKFDPKLGTEFTTFATPVIKNEILMSMRKNKQNIYPDISLNAIIKDEENHIHEYGEFVPDQFNLEDCALSSGLVNVVHEVIEKEKPRNKKIIRNYLNGINQTENARICGVSQTQVSRIIKRFRSRIADEWRG